MGRLSLEDKKKRDQLILKYNKYMELLKNSEGCLFLIDMAKLLNEENYITRYALEILEKNKLVSIDVIETETVAKAVVRLTRIGWLSVKVDRDMVAINSAKLEESLFYAIIYIWNKETNQIDDRIGLNDVFYEDVKNLLKGHSQLNSRYYEIIDIDKLFNKDKKKNKKNKFIITDYNLADKKKYINIIYYEKIIYVKELILFLDHLTGLLELYNFEKLGIGEFLSRKGLDVKINLTVISQKDILKTDLLTPLQNHGRLYHYYSTSPTRDMKRVYRRNFKYVTFKYTDFNELSLKKY